MKVLIAGGAGYIGSKLTIRLLERNDSVVILDAGFFGNAFSVFSQHPKLTVLMDDIRSFDKACLTGIDAVIDLAGLSSDASAEASKEIAEQINHRGATRLATLSKQAGIKRYIYSSSCSVYGITGDVVSETSKLNPVTKYAQTKIAAEEGIKKISDENFHTLILRNATVYGLSKRQMRFDLIVNRMTLHAYIHNKIQIFGAGNQWRPLIHIDDIVDAFIVALNTSAQTFSSGEVFNVGDNNQNFTVSGVAKIVSSCFPNVLIENTPSNNDNRSYRVNFDKFNQTFKHTIKRGINDGVREIVEALKKGQTRHTPESDRGAYTMSLIKNGKLR